MARSVSLSDEAFAALRAEKRAGESDSDVVLRLRRTAHRKERDPANFFRNPPKPGWTEAEYDEVREKMRAADIKKAKDLYAGP